MTAVVLAVFALVPAGLLVVESRIRIVKGILFASNKSLGTFRVATPHISIKDVPKLCVFVISLVPAIDIEKRYARSDQGSKSYDNVMHDYRCTICRTTKHDYAQWCATRRDWAQLYTTIHDCAQ